jgi:hypothetical protein
LATRSKVNDNPYGDDALVAIRGYRERLTPGTRYKVIEIDFTADPEKDNPEWLLEQYRLMGESMVRREVLRDWTVAEGSAFYPEYANHGGMARYGFRANGLLIGFVYRGYDFGIRRPVCIWLQIGSSGRVYVLRELALKDCDAYTFADLVKFYSGQLPEAEMMPSAQEVYAQLLADGHDRGPWFPPKVPYLDISGPECFNTTANAKPNDPRTTYDIFAAAGIALEAPRILINDRTEVMRKLLHLDRKGRPSILIDERCPEVHAMFNGGLSFPKGTIDDPTPNHPRKDGWFDNIHDGLTYPIGQLIPAADKPAPEVRKSYGGPAGRTPVVQVDDDSEESLGFYETRQITK